MFCWNQPSFFPLNSLEANFKTVSFCNDEYSKGSMVDNSPTQKAKEWLQINILVDNNAHKLIVGWAEN